MERAKIIQYEDRDIVSVDLSNCVPQDTAQVLPAASQLIQKSPPKSCLVLTDVTGAVYDKPTAEAIKNFVRNNTPHIKASAILGADGIRGVLLQTVIFLTRREIKSFNNRKEALDWLISHK